MRALLAACLTTLLLVVAAGPAAAQAPAESLGARTVRFPIAAIADSTFTFGVVGSPWVKAGARGLAVDPRRNDVLVARFVVTSVESGIATALVTGETTRLQSQHVALLAAPREKHHRSYAVGIAAVLGLVVGFVAGKAF